MDSMTITQRPVAQTSGAHHSPRRESDESRTAREFEAVFLTQAVEQMMSNVDIGSFGGGDAEKTWRGFLARAVADEIAAQGRTGIAQSVGVAMSAYGTAKG
ncbi:rod-binding protein [Profundibacterium mesophilum]|uniref:Chemotactic signal-response protein CheL n=1 Tax=Profundibacterium mesophilum KAUST100406-0324 TaxID=1037889 RepID=A0A921TB21_9RHOB|nr:rod-binding protein [Profundibacterium mesophilum]KAF0674640.1 Chemotactic signal-response protein CheL [Profundibacterium mesophilum KAUST100406-0324]